MKIEVTQEMEDAYISAAYQEHEQVTASVTAGLEAVLPLLPNVEPFAFEGTTYPVFLHRCGTVVDAPEGSEMREQVDAGECDCENTSPWYRIWVEKSA